MIQTMIPQVASFSAPKVRTHASTQQYGMRASPAAKLGSAASLRSQFRERLGSTRQQFSTNRWRSRGAQLAVLAAAAADLETEVVIVGGGVAGLTCAKTLHKAGVSFVVVEAEDTMGGRVRTEKTEEGFLLDRGFQIFLTSYPEAQAQLDYEALDLKPFYAGADVFWNGDFHRVADPFRHFSDGIMSLPNPIGSVLDKVRVGLLRVSAVAQPTDSILQDEEKTTFKKLTDFGFSTEMIDRFFRPFLGGIFFDRQLNVTSRLLMFVMRMLALGSNCLPSAGIGAVAEQLSSGLPSECLMTGTKVTSLTPATSEPAQVSLSTGASISASKAVVVATEGPNAASLLGQPLESTPSQAGEGVGTICLYFAADKPTSLEPILYLNGEDDGIVNNCTWLTNVAPSYAPEGQALLSVSVIGVPDMADSEVISEVKSQLSGWFGSEAVSTWRSLAVQRIPFCQPPQSPPTNLLRPVSLGNGLYVCGDHRESATLDGALKSGRRAAEAIIEAK